MAVREALLLRHTEGAYYIGAMLDIRAFFIANGRGVGVRADSRIGEMIVKFFLVVVCALSALGLASRADALVLYASTAAGAAGELYTLDATTGAVVNNVGPLNDLNGVNYSMTGLAFQSHSGALLGSTGSSNPATAAMLVKINPATAQVLVIGAFNVGAGVTMTDLAFDSAGILYGVGSVGGAHLYTINTSTGQATQFGDSGLAFTSGGGLAISSAGVFYGTPLANMYGTYDPVTGAYSNITNPVKPAGSGSYTALDFNGSVLFGLNTASRPSPGVPPATHLVTIVPATGAVTDVGVSLDSLDAIAFQPAAAGTLAGDYNSNGVVDAADYVLWRKN